MSISVVGDLGWTRVLLDKAGELAEAERALGFAARPGTGRAGASAFPLRLMTSRDGVAEVDEVTVVLREDLIVTVEPAGGASVLNEVEARLRPASATGPYGVCLALVEAGYTAVAHSLAMVERDLRCVHQLMTGLNLDVDAVKSVGVSDLPQVSEYLTEIDRALSHASYTVGRLTQLARLLRQEAVGSPATPRPRLDDLVLQGQALARRLEFIVDRHRFHAQSATEQISTSDLNVVKIFTVLWAILIPGTTLINWYGQNFQFMPALSWPYTSWVQLAGVFLLSSIPIYIIKRSGQLR